jgi:ribonuclease-3
MDRYLLLGRGEAEAGGATRPSLLAAAFEAVAGALYLSEGLTATRDWLLGVIGEQLERAGEGVHKSAKSRLQELTQRQHRTKPHYELVATIGPPHDQTFTVAAVLDGRRLATGTGSSRQRAEEQAAGSALQALVVDAPEPPA